MKQFMDDNFLLGSKTAEKLYHEYAKDMPIYDYHCHLSAKEIAGNKRYQNITEVWLGGDHYKWRALRINGFDERFITGKADDREKFQKWAEVMPYCIGNPLYNWSHLELKRLFNIDKLLGPDTAEEIWQECNRRLKEDGFSARGLIERANVRLICTTDDPCDDLEYHKQIADDNTFKVKVLPAFRPDKGFNIEKEGFADYVAKLGNKADMHIDTFDKLIKALKIRVKYFHEAGCRISDHALDHMVFEKGTEKDANEIFVKALRGDKLTESEISIFKTLVLIFLGKQYAELGWVMQLHLGTMRNNNTRMMKILGPDTGFDAIGDYSFARALSSFLDSLDVTGELPKTIIYSLNPAQNEVLAAITGCFQGGGAPGKLQFGSAWWFNDQKDGMEKQMIALANMGLLSRFIGMLTDSRSFLSYTRHEYFRRILCNILGRWIEDGEAPNDMELAGNMVRDICYNNAREYFNIEL